MLSIEPVTLSSALVTLRPLSVEDVPALRAAVADGELWEKKTTVVPPPEKVEAYVRAALELQKAGQQLPFVTVVNDGNIVVGSTRYMNIDALNHRLEIGTTWLSRSWQRTFVNTHAKFLMLQHAFETLGCIAVEWRTHVLNTQSRAAIERLGAKFDGILRSHMIMPEGSIRDTAVYSVIRAEWPEVKATLEGRMDAARPAA